MNRELLPEEVLRVAERLFRRETPSEAKQAGEATKDDIMMMIVTLSELPHS